MGIKFKGKTTTGVPSASAIKERELEINLVDKKLFTSSDGTDIIDLTPDELGGKLHTTVGKLYKVGDSVTLTGSNYAYVCKTEHTSTVDCNLAPDDVNWYQPDPEVISFTYNFTTELLGTSCGDTPLIIPPDPLHTYEDDGLTGIPNENGPCWFSINPNAVGRNAVVLLEGFELRPDEYDTSTLGYINILSPVADNSWLKVQIQTQT